MKLLNILAIIVIATGFAACGNSNNKQAAVTNEEAKVQAVENKNNIEPDSTGYIIRVGMQVPDITWTEANGKTVSMQELRGKVVMLQFTASWCSVCRKEMPFIERDIWQKHKNNNDFYLVGIDRDEPLETVQEFAEKTGVTYPLALDPGADIFAQFALRESGITRNVLVDRDGTIVMTTRLYNEEEFGRLVEKIDSMLK
ncbi:MAG: TlpA disulfide reductase family protein [Bacteroidales bacterium]|nr:TlpA disulfide reductase family protein [Bacteroidales bacterium]